MSRASALRMAPKTGGSLSCNNFFNLVFRLQSSAFSAMSIRRVYEVHYVIPLVLWHKSVSAPRGLRSLRVSSRWNRQCLCDDSDPEIPVAAPTNLSISFLQSHWHTF